MRSSIAFLLAAATVLPAAGQTVGRSGEVVYREACMTCHASGLNKAPKLGDAKDWAPRIREGQAGLTAVAWMARQSGGNWQDPDAALLSRIDAAVKKREARAKKPANS